MSHEGEITFLQFMALCHELFPGDKDFQDKTSRLTGVFMSMNNKKRRLKHQEPLANDPITVYTAMLTIKGKKLRMCMSYPNRGKLDVNIYTRPNQIEATVNGNPAEEALREFARRLLNSE